MTATDITILHAIGANGLVDTSDDSGNPDDAAAPTEIRDASPTRAPYSACNT